MILVIHNVEILFSFRLNAFLQEPTTLTTHHRKRKRMMLCSQTVNMFTTGRWRQRFLRSQMTPPVWPTPTSPTKMLSRTTTQASLVPCSSASLVSSKLWICLQFCLIGGKAQNVNCCCLELNWWIIFDLSFPLSYILSLSRQSGWAGGADWRPPGVCVPLWGFWWEREHVQSKWPRHRQPCKIYHQRIHKGIATWLVSHLDSKSNCQLVDQVS